MKMIKKILFCLIICFSFLTMSNASVNTCDRNELDNYGVNKKWEITNSNKSNVLNTPCVDASEKIYDFANILSETEEELLYDEIMKFINKYDTELIFVTVNMAYSYDEKNEEYAADFYDYNDFGIDFDNYDGILLLRNAYVNDPYYDMYTFGEAQLYFDQNRYDDILDGIYYNFKSKIYFTGYMNFINYINYYYEQGTAYNQNEYYVDDMGYIRQYFVPPLGVSFFGAGIMTLGILTYLTKKNKMVKKASVARDYLDKNSIVFTNKEDIFLTSSTVRHVHTSSSGGSGRSSGGGSRSASSGGGHSRGGGRHG